MNYWGKHLVLDARGCNIDKSNDPEYIKEFVKELVKTIDMVPYGEPQVVHFADGGDKAGWTVIQLIETSSIVGHFLDHNGDLYLDVFSCKDFSAMTVQSLLDEWFKPELCYMNTIMRDARIGSKADFWVEGVVGKQQ
jgi:S-adenosylmethionine/arginine decarboxylase-like enzyme